MYMCSCAHIHVHMIHVHMYVSYLPMYYYSWLLDSLELEIRLTRFCSIVGDSARWADRDVPEYGGPSEGTEHWLWPSLLLRILVSRSTADAGTFKMAAPETHVRETLGRLNGMSKYPVCTVVCDICTFYARYFCKAPLCPSYPCAEFFGVIGRNGIPFHSYEFLIN